MGKIVLVTGGAGFIGNAFCKLLLKERKDWIVINVDSLTYAANKNTIASELNNPNYFFIEADIRDRTTIFEIFNEVKPDYVVNFAAESHVDRSFGNEDYFIDVNVTGLRVLLEAAVKHHVKKFHQVSTDEVYGAFPLDKKRQVFDEKAELRPTSPYAQSKATADLLAISFYHDFGLPVTVSRGTNTYGPYQYPEKLIPLTIYNALHKKKVPVYGNGENIRDWLYVEDHARGILAILENGKKGQIYNLGGKNEMSNINLVKLILTELKKSEKLIEFVKDRPNHDERYGVSIVKAKTLGWKPLVKFNDGIKDTIKWYKKNKKWLEECINDDYLAWIKRNYEERDS